MDPDVDTVALIEESGIDSLTGIGEAVVSPARIPALADDESSVAGLAHHADAMTIPYRIGLEDVEITAGEVGVIPGGIHT